MPNILDALTKKKSALIRAKFSLKADYERQVREIDAELRNIDLAYQTLNEAVADYICPVCGGTGNTRRCDAAGQMEDWPCTACNGTGVKMGGKQDV